MADMKKKEQSRLSGENAAIVAAAEQAAKEPKKSKAVQKREAVQKGKSLDEVTITDPESLKSGKNPFDDTVKKLKGEDTEDFSKAEDKGRG